MKNVCDTPAMPAQVDSKFNALRLKRIERNITGNAKELVNTDHLDSHNAMAF